MKTCPDCKINLPINSFYPNKARKDKCSTYCKKCQLRRCAESIARRKIKDDRIIPDFRRCYKCKDTKPENEFSRNITTTDGLSAACRRCTREEWLIRGYNLTLLQYEAISKSQDDKCAICKRDPAFTNKPLVVDHCHISNNVRKLICDKCNRGLGAFEDRVDYIKSALEYLLEFEPVQSE